MTERRRFLRFETALNSICEIVAEKWKAPSKVRNISKDGALIILNKQLGHGSEMNLSLDVPGDNIPIFASCQVAWQRTYDDRGFYETGVKFTKIDSLDKGRLLEFIYAQWLKLLDGK